MRLALYQPEIPQNTGTLLRLGACLGVGVDIIEPCGFVWNDARLKRAGMDYMELVTVQRHVSWRSFKDQVTSRLILLDAKATTSFLDFQFQPEDILVLGQESRGVPDSVYEEMSHQVIIPMVPGRRSLNVAISAAIVLSEALRQTKLYPLPSVQLLCES